MIPRLHKATEKQFAITVVLSFTALAACIAALVFLVFHSHVQDRRIRRVTQQQIKIERPTLQQRQEGVLQAIRELSPTAKKLLLRQLLQGATVEQRKGLAGRQGSQGARGTNGTPGSTGKPGTRGIAGGNGGRGPQGPPGPAGPQGPRGPQGPPGPPGPAAQVPPALCSRLHICP